MLNLLDSSNLLIDTATEVLRQGEIQNKYNVYGADRCVDLDIRALLDLKHMTFDFNLKYRSYPSSLKKLDK